MTVCTVHGDQAVYGIERLFPVFGLATIDVDVDRWYMYPAEGIVGIFLKNSNISASGIVEYGNKIVASDIEELVKELSLVDDTRYMVDTIRRKIVTKEGFIFETDDWGIFPPDTRKVHSVILVSSEYKFYTFAGAEGRAAIVMMMKEFAHRFIEPQYSDETYITGLRVGCILLEQQYGIPHVTLPREMPGKKFSNLRKFPGDLKCFENIRSITVKALPDKKEPEKDKDVAILTASDICDPTNSAVKEIKEADDLKAISLMVLVDAGCEWYAELCPIPISIDINLSESLPPGVTVESGTLVLDADGIPCPDFTIANNPEISGISEWEDIGEIVATCLGLDITYTVLDILP